MQRSAVVGEDSLLAPLDQGLHQVGPQLQRLLATLEWQTGQKRSTLFIIMVVLLCIYMVTSKNAPLVCSLVVYLIAAYSSFHNIENSSKNDDSRWIIFWLIFGFFNMLDYFTDQIRANFPLFWAFKASQNCCAVLLFLTWCLAPTGTNGVTVIYLHLLYPLFLAANDHRIMDFESSRSLCSRIWLQCYPWAQEPEPRARKMEDSGEPARPAVREEPPHASEKESATRKPAGDGKGKRSPVHKADDVKQKKEATKVDDDSANTAKGAAENIAILSATEKDKKPEVVGGKLPEATGKGAGTTAGEGTKEEVHPAAHKMARSRPCRPAKHHITYTLNTSHTHLLPPKSSKPPSQTATKSASDTVIKSKTGSQDEGTYQSHLSSYQNARHERGAGASSWNDVSLFSRKEDDSGSAARKCDDGRGGPLLASSKSSIPIIQPVLQPLFSLYSSPYSSICGSANNVSGQPPAGPYAFGPSYPSYHAGPFYPGCLQRPPLGYNRPRMLLYGGPTQRQKSLSLRNAPCLEELESDMDDSRPARKRKSLSLSTNGKLRDDDDGADAVQKEDHRASPNKEEGKKTAMEEKLEVEKRADKKSAH
ncbi:hypothetical protein MTO96_016323 [Rhipicephalus appendiculatus]